MQAFLQRLWDLQARASLSDAALAREMGVDQALISRAKRGPAKTVGIKFILGATDRFPELRRLLFPEVSIITSDVQKLTDERAS